MRHGKKVNHLGRKAAHRKAMLANMAISLIEHKRITTTLAKAKALRVYVEPLLTKAKNDTMHSRRVVFSYLNNKEAIKELYGPIAAAIMDRPGGYTRILKIGNRKGDNAEMAFMELVDFSEFAPGKTGTTSSSRRRRRRRKKEDDAVTKSVEETQENVTSAIEEAEVVATETVEEVETAAEEVVENAEAALEEAAEEVSEEVAEASDDTPAEGEEPKKEGEA